MPTRSVPTAPLQFSFAGSRSAQADRTLLMQAQDRAERGEDAETIRRDTGWHQGAEGRWRFEIADNSAGFNTHLLENLHSGGFSSRTIEHVSYRKDADNTYQLSLAPLAPQRVSDFVSIRSIPEHMLRSLLPQSALLAIEQGEGEEDLIGANLDDAKRVRAPFEFSGFDALPLDVVMDHPALFAAYPALRDVMVTVVPKLGTGATLGTLDYEDGSVVRVIQIGSPRFKDVGSLILHEVQHAIQEIEGFAPGGRIQPLTDEQIADGTGLSAGERYRRLAGEVEARNTQARRLMSADERRQTSPETTADVPRAERIVQKNDDPVTDQTTSAAFKAWFGGSKIVAADGKPLLVYHGTASDFTVFQGGRGGFYFTDDQQAAKVYADQADGDEPRTIGAYLSMANPMVLDRAWYDENVMAGGEPAWEAVDNAIYEAEENGHDGLILRGFPDFAGIENGVRIERAYDQYVAFQPEQIKSATDNNGQFDRSSPDIRFSMADAADAPPAEQTRSHAFQQWFGEYSTLVNPDGSPMVLYHGTGSKFTQFRRSKTGAMGPGVYLGDSREVAQGYDGDGKGVQTVMAVYARGKYLSNRKWSEYVQDYGWAGAEAAATADGWSGVHDQMFESAVAVWDPAQIKSATDNNGQFDSNNPDIRFSMADAAEVEQPTEFSQSQSEAFQRWFGTSKVTSADGMPLVVYHGTGADFSAFSANEVGSKHVDIFEQYGDGGAAGGLFYFSDDHKTANWYAKDSAKTNKPKGGANVMPVYLALQNPLIVNFQGEGIEYLSEEIELAKASGNDGLILRNYDDGGVSDHYIAFRSEQIKSAIGNNGQFDATNPDIRFSMAGTVEAPTVDQAQTDAFKQWFEGSTVVAENGQPLVVHHGTTAEFSVFDGLEVAGWFSAEASLAEERYQNSGVVMTAFLSIKNPKVLDFDMDDAGESGEPMFESINNSLYVDSLIKQGFDGIKVRENGVYTYAVFRPEQVKSATDNNGQFDSNNPDIRFSMAGTVEAPDQVQTEAFQDWFGASKVVTAQGAPMVMYHGTTETTYVPGTTQAGSASARAELERMAATHGIKEWNDVPAVFERWLEMGQADGFGVTQQVAEHARELQRQARATITAPARVDLGFSVFDMPGMGKELGAHFGTREQALARGVPFAFYLQVENPLRLPDLGTWDYQAVMGAARKRGVAISEAEYDAVFNARDSNAALRTLLTAKGYDGVVYENEAEGRGDSLIVFRPEQIKSATDNNGQFDPENPDVRFSFGEVAQSPRPEFFSPLLRAIEQAPARIGPMPADQWSAWILSSASRVGLKKDEIEWSGVLDYLASRGTEKTTRNDLTTYLSERGVRVGEVIYGGAKPHESLTPDYADDSGTWLVVNEEGSVVADELATRESALEWIAGYQGDVREAPQYAAHVVPGGENYREVLVTLPGVEGHMRKQWTMFDADGQAIAVRSEPPNQRWFDSVENKGYSIEERLVADAQANERAGSFTSSHWKQPNILAHLRLDDRIDADGKKVLMIHEIQSDWGQQGKSAGIRTPFKSKIPNVTAKVLTGSQFVAERSMPEAAAQFWLQGRNDIRKDLGEQPVSMGDSFTILYENGIPKIIKDGALDTDSLVKRHIKRHEAIVLAAKREHAATQAQRVPAAPFIGDTKAWAALAIKRAIMMAVEGDYDKVAIIGGQQAAELHKLNKDVESLSVEQNHDGTYDISVETENDDFTLSNKTVAEVEATIGKELATKAIRAANAWAVADRQYRSALHSDEHSDAELDKLRAARERIQTAFSADDLRLGGKGLISFYDEIIPQVARDVVKKLGGGPLQSVEYPSRFEVIESGGGWVVKDTKNAMLYRGEKAARPWAVEEKAAKVFLSEATAHSAVQTMAGNEDLAPQLGFEITPAMRLKVLAGVPLFSRARQPGEAAPQPEGSADMLRMQELLDADPTFGALQRAHTQDFRRIAASHGTPVLDWARVPEDEREAYFAREIELLKCPDHLEYASLQAKLRTGKASVASLQAAIRTLVNDAGALGRGLGSIVACSARDIKETWAPLIGVDAKASEQASRAQGFFVQSSSTVFLIADNIHAGDELGVVAHELMHKHGEAVLGAEGWEQLHGAIKGWSSARPGSPERAIHDEATRRVAASRPAGMSAEAYSSQELFPYAVEAALKMGIEPSWNAPKDSASGWLARVRSTLGSVWAKISGKPREMEAQDLVTLAYGIAHREVDEFDIDFGRERENADPLASASFRQWFAESKAVDGTGKPLVLYHGTDAAFDAFDYAKAGKHGRGEGAGFYFTDNPVVATMYGRPMHVHLSVQNPLPFDAKPFGRAVTEKLVRRLATIEAQEHNTPVEDGFLSNFGDVRHEGLEKVVRSATALLSKNALAIDQLGDLAGSGVSMALVNQACFEVTGHDSIASKGFSNCGVDGNNIFVAFFPQQIKSATNNCGQFDPKSDNIYHSAALQPREALAAKEAWSRFREHASADALNRMAAGVEISNSSIVALLEDGLLSPAHPQFPSLVGCAESEPPRDRQRSC